MQDDQTPPSDSGPQQSVGTAAAEPAVTTPESASPAPQSEVFTAPSSHRGRTFTIILLILIVLASAGFAAYRLSQPQKPVVVTPVKHEVPLLRVGMQDALPAAFYPGNEAEVAQVDVNRQIFEGLTSIQDKTKVAPGLALSWTTPDSTTWVFNLRQGVYFHDGHLMTAQLVKASLDSAHDSPTWKSFGGSIKAVSIVDASSIKVITDGPDPLLTIKLSNLWIFDTTSGKTNDTTNGTGPYILKPGTQLTDQSIKLVAYDKYWGGRPLTREVDYSYLSDDDAAAAAMKNGTLDLANFNEVAAISKLGSAYKIQQVFSPLVQFLIPNALNTKSPLSKLAVRQAVYSALDPVALAASHGDDGTPIGQIVPQEIPGYDASLKRPALDIVKAKQELAQAGYPNGFTIKLTYYSSPTREQFADEIQKELAKIGVTITKDPITDASVLQNIIFGGKTDLSVEGYVSDLLDTNDVVSTMVVQTKNYTDPALTSLRDQAAVELNPGNRLALLQQENRSIMNNLALFPLYQFNGSPLAYRSDSNLVLNQQITDTITGLYFYQVYSK